jgi:hypothetical protein
MCFIRIEKMSRTADVDEADGRCFNMQSSRLGFGGPSLKIGCLPRAEDDRGPPGKHKVK